MEPKVRAERKGKESNRYEGKEKKSQSSTKAKWRVSVRMEEEERECRRVHAWHCIALRSDRKGQADEQGNGLDPVSLDSPVLYMPRAERTTGVPEGTGWAPQRSIRHCLGTMRYLWVVPAHPPTAQWSELGGTCLVRLVRLQDACLCLWMRRVLDSN